MHNTIAILDRGATAPWTYSWDAFPPTLEITGTKYICSRPTFATSCHFTCHCGSFKTSPDTAKLDLKDGSKKKSRGGNRRTGGGAITEGTGEMMEGPLQPFSRDCACDSRRCHITFHVAISTHCFDALAVGAGRIRRMLPGRHLDVDAKKNLHSFLNSLQ